jgi:hypothetical protein
VILLVFVVLGVLAIVMGISGLRRLIEWKHVRKYDRRAMLAERQRMRNQGK